VQSGAGCGSVDLGGVTNPVYGPVFRATFTGNLRDFTVQLHHLVLSQVREGPALSIRVYADIDGIPPFPEGPQGGRAVTVAPVRSSTGASELFEFTVTDVGADDGSGAAYEDGDGLDEHELTVYVGLTEYPQPGAWVWDTTQVPSGIVFNPATPASVAANKPDYEA
jgi:hypothetical protein